MSTQTVPYALDNDEPTAHAMHDHLSAVLDPFTRQRLIEAGIAKDKMCWEIGAGNGSVAAWMAEQVGPGSGYVLATDIKPQHIRAAGTLMAVKKHDVATEEPPLDEADLIHARLLFAHLPSRVDTLAVVARVLAPGGALVIEDWGQWSGPLLYSPIPHAAEIYSRYQKALLDVFRSFGNDPTWAVSTAAAMTAAGLTDVETEVSAQTWRGGTAGALLPIVVSTELRTPLLGCGASADDLDALPEIMQNPGTLVLGNPTVSTIGRRLR
jgi:ubiquinone/menaquinone biosynthesis C-methylase UbiE